MPVPNSEVTLNGTDLISQAQTEKTELITQLRENLTATSREQQLIKSVAIADNLQSQLSKIPLPFFLGSVLLFIIPLMKFI